MTKKTPLLVILVFSFMFSLYAERQLVRISGADEMFIQQLLKGNYDVALYRPNHFIDLVLNEQQLSEFKKMDPDIQIMVTENQMKANLSSSTKDIPGYRNYSQTIALLNEYATTYPNICQLHILGNSTGADYLASNYGTVYNDFNHQLIALKVSDNPEIEEDEPSFYFMGGHHAREPLGTEVSMAVLFHYLSLYNTDPVITDLINTSQIWFLPMVNPDGQKVVLDQTDVWWRKNIRDNNNNHQFDTYDQWGYGPDGIDINRNYGYGWGYFSSTDDITYPTYHGTEPFSETETTIVKNLLDSHQFVAGISYHTYGGLVLYPWGSLPNIVSPDGLALSDLANQMADTILKTDGSNMHYDPGYGWELYPASGGLDEYAYGQNGIFGYTIELAEEFIPSVSIVTQTCQNNLEASKLLVSRVKKACLTGLIKDTDNNPVVAEVFVEGVDNTGYAKQPYLSNAQFGRYFRLLMPGVYTVFFRAWGYQTQTQQIIIDPNEQTVLDVVLEPSMICTVSGFVIDELGTQAVPQTAVSIINSGLDPVYTDDNGFFVIDQVCTGNQEILINKAGGDKLQISIPLHPDNNWFTFTLSQAIVSDCFDNTSLNWIKTGSWGLNTTQYVSPGKSLADSPSGNYTPDNLSYCKFPESVDLTDCTNATVSFMAKHSIALKGEYINFEISTDNQNWQALKVFIGDQPEWTEYFFNLNAYIGQSLWFRFLYENNYNSTADGIYIDDFKVFKDTFILPVNDHTVTPSAFKILGNYPNPFNPETHIRFQINQPGQVEMNIYNIKGQKVFSQKQSFSQAGVHQMNWTGTDNQQHQTGSGIYFYRLNYQGNTRTGKMLLMK